VLRDEQSVTTATADEPTIEIRGVHKSYGSLHVLRGIDLTIARGEAFGLLGPNGAGKSTLTHIILGLLLPDQGSVRVFGSQDIERVSARIGYLPERPRYHTQFTGREYLATLGRLSDLQGDRLEDRIDTVIELVALQTAADRRVGTYSKGMLQRLGLAQALIHEPDLLVVDEPASGLDPEGQSDMATMLQRVHNAGHTVILCTHQLNEVARLCDRVGILINGRLDPIAGVADLHAQGHSVTVRVQDLSAETAQALTNLSDNVRCTRTEIVIFPVTDELQARVLKLLLDDEVPIVAVIPEADALEQFYMRAIHATDGPDSAQKLATRRADNLLQVLIGEDKE
jgi:ABC-2 type transport system ATP-binding protein